MIHFPPSIFRQLRSVLLKSTLAGGKWRAKDGDRQLGVLCRSNNVQQLDRFATSKTVSVPLDMPVAPFGESVTTIERRFEFGASDLFGIWRLVLGISCPKNNAFGLTGVEHPPSLTLLKLR